MLDIEMPDLDGLTALPLLLEKKRDLIVIMASTLTRRNAEMSLKALVARRRRLCSEARDQPRGHHLGGVPPRADRKDPPARRAAQARLRRGAGRAARAPAVRGAVRAGNGAAPEVLRRGAAQRRAASGLARHQAAAVLGDRAARAADRLLDRRAAGADRPGRARSSRSIGRAPVLITQHMPPTFTTILAEHLARASGQTAHEAIDGEPIVRRHDLSRARRQAHDGGEAQQPAGDLAQRRPAGEFLPARGRSAVRLGRAGVGQRDPRRRC